MYACHNVYLQWRNDFVRETVQTSEVKHYASCNFHSQQTCSPVQVNHYHSALIGGRGRRGGITVFNRDEVFEKLARQVELEYIACMYSIHALKIKFS